MMAGMGLPNLNIIKRWTLVGFNCYLFLSLNFVGIFAQEAPARLANHQQSWVSKKVQKIHILIQT